MKRNDDLLLHNISGENLLVPLGSRVMDLNGMVILNNTGCFIWSLLAEECSADYLANSMAERFDVDVEHAAVDVRNFVDELAHGSFGMSTLPTQYGPLTDELFRCASDRRQPISASFELTTRCNLACRMCAVRHPADDVARRAKELPAAAWLSLANQAVGHGMLFLILTGGEVFLRPDFFEIFEPLTRLGLLIAVRTNGTLISEAVAERLAQAPPNCTTITLYGATAATYEAVTGVIGSYTHCCAGIESLIKCRVPLELKITITRQNVGELEAMRQMAHNWGVPFSGNWLLGKRPDGTPSEVEKCRLSVQDCIKLESTDRISADEWSDVTLMGYATAGDYNFHCLCGKAHFAINPAGEINACLSLPRPAAKPLEVGFAVAWEQVKEYVDSLRIASVCLSCDARVYCKRCPGWSLTETNTLTEPVPYLCQIARAKELL